VTEQLEIVHLRGDTSHYLIPPSGHPSFNLNKVTRDGLLFDLRAAIKVAKNSRAPIHRKNLAIQSDHGVVHADIEVRAYTPAGTREQYFIVAFHDAWRQKPKVNKSARSNRTQTRGTKGGRITGNSEIASISP
jgi:two-component system, chemotaxis family, CheB/CheR fusion protein